MKIKFKRITALFAALAIMITALPLTIIPISAAGTDGESTEYSSDGYLIVRSYRQLRLAYNGSEESKIRLGADIDCDPEEYKPNYLTRLCPPIESDKTLDLAGYTLKKTGNSIDSKDHLLSVEYSKLTIEDSVGTGKMYFYAKDVAQNLFLAENRSTIVINGGTFCYTGTNAMYCEMIKLSASDLVINDGYFDAQIGTPIKLDNGFAGKQRTLNSTALINGGTIVTTSSIALSSIDGCDYYASLVMTGGTITNKSKGRVTDKTGTIISDPYFVRVTSDEALQKKYYNITLLGGTMPLSPNDIEVYYPTEKAVLTSKAGTITNSAEKVEYTTLLTAPQAGIDEKKAMAARGADEICRLKTDRNNYVLSNNKRTRFTVNSNSVGKIDLLTQAPNPYGTGDPIKTVDWYVSKNFGSFTGIPEAINDLSYTPPEVTEKCTMLYKAVINYGNVLRINEIIIIDYDFEAVTEIKAVVSGFHGGSTLSDVSVASGEPEKYSLTINNIRDVYGNNIVNDRQLSKGFKYNIFIKVKLNSGYVAAYTTGTVKMRRFEDPANEWQAADHIYIGLNEIAFKSVLVCDEGIRTVGVEISNFLPYRKVNDLQLTSSEPDKYSVTLVTPLLNTWEYNEEVYDDDELIVDAVYLNVNTNPNTPTGMKCVAKTISEIKLQWDKNTSADGYMIDVYDGTKWKPIKTFTSNANTSFDIKGLKASLTYKFRMRAYKTFGSVTEYSDAVYLNVNTNPNTPTGMKCVAKTISEIKLQWDKNTSADGYMIDVYDGTKWKPIKTFTSNANTSYDIVGLHAGTTYKFRLRAYKAFGSVTEYSAYSAELNVTTDPSVITGAVLGGRAADALRVNWNKNTSADGYIVEMYQGENWVSVAKITDNSTTTFRKAGLAPSTVYKFRVRAYKIDGKAELYGNYSSTVTARTNPSVITGAVLGGRAADALRVNWSKNTSADGYIVEMYQGENWVRVAKITDNSTTTFKKAGLDASTVYKFRVRAYKMDGTTALYGNYSSTVTARTNPSVMTGVKIGGVANDALRVNWNKNASAQGYIIEMYQGEKWVRVAKITDNNTTTFRKAGLAKNTTYKFRVKAYYMSGKTALYGNYGSVSGKTAAK